MEARGAINQYFCKDCGYSIYTINLNCGVTGFSSICPRCKKYNSYSCFYQLRDREIIVTYGMYRPTKEEYDKLDKNSQSHVLNGGLLKKSLSELYSYLQDNIKEDISHEDWKKFAEETYVR